MNLSLIAQGLRLIADGLDSAAVTSPETAPVAVEEPKPKRQRKAADVPAPATTPDPGVGVPAQHMPLTVPEEEAQEYNAAAPAPIPEPDPLPQGAAFEITLEALTRTLLAFAQAKGKPAALAKLAAFGATKLREVPQDKWLQLYALLQEGAE